MKITHTTIGAVAKIFDGPHATPTRTTSGPYFLNIASLSGGRLNLNESDHVSEEDFRRWTKRVTPMTDDLLFSYETRLGEAALMPRDTVACLGRRMALLRFDPNQVDPAFFLYYYISPPFKEVVDARTIYGATVNRIALSSMADWPIELPELWNQKAISRLLGSLDSKITSNSATIDKAEILSDWVTRTTSHWTTLNDVASVSKKVHKPTQMGPNPVLHFSLPSFDNGRRPVREMPSSILSNKLVLDSPSVLISKLNPRISRVWDILELEDVPSYCSTEFVVLKPTLSSTSVLAACLRHPSVTDQISALVAGTSGSHQRVKIQDLLSVSIPDPQGLDEDSRRLITQLGSRSNAAQLETATLKELRDTLLPELMTGKLRIRDAERQVKQVRYNASTR